MKYLMALVISVGFVAGAVAQDMGQGKFREESDKDKLETGSMDKSGEPTQAKRFSSGSIYYFDNPNETERTVGGNSIKDNAGEDKAMELKAGEDIGKAVEAKAAPETSLDRRCEFQKMLSDRQGAFKVERDNDTEDYKIQREKDGDENIKYFTDDEYYYYKKDNDGESAYSYGKRTGNGRVEVMKNKDGSGSVIYEEYFDNIEDSGVLENGFNFEGSEPSCSLTE
jgi:hypothetical protein